MSHKKIKIQTRHDLFFRKAMSNKLASREFMNSHLPETLKKLVDTSSLHLEQESFVEDELKNSISDVLFSVKLNDGSDGYIYILLEHQSSSDKWMALRLQKYMINVCDKHLADNPEAKKLPLVYPMVFYNGKGRYRSERNFWNLFNKKELAKEFWTSDHQLINVHDIPDDELKQQSFAGLMQFLMKHIHDRDLINIWRDLMKDAIINKVIEVDVGYDYLRIAFRYIATRLNRDNIANIEELWKSTTREKSEGNMISVAEEWAMQGLQQGKMEEKVHMAKIMIEKHLDLAFIADITGLDMTQIQQLSHM